MSEQDLVEQLADYGDWLARATGVDIRPDQIQILDTAEGELVAGDAERLRRNKRSEHGMLRSLLVAAAGLAVVAAGWIVLSHGTDSQEPADFREDLVLSGETVLQGSPLVVAAATYELSFDPGYLGTELAWEPILEIDDEVSELLAELLERTESDGRIPVKMTVLGRLRGLPWIIEVSDGPDPRPGEIAVSGNLRIRLVATPGEGSGSADPVSVDSRSFIDPLEDEQMTINASSDSTNSGSWVEVSAFPADTAVVSWVDQDQRFWMQPRGWAAFFPAKFDRNTEFTVSAYSSDGSLLGSRSSG